MSYHVQGCWPSWGNSEYFNNNLDPRDWKQSGCASDDVGLRGRLQVVWLLRLTLQVDVATDLGFEARHKRSTRIPPECPVLRPFGTGNSATGDLLSYHKCRLVLPIVARLHCFAWYLSCGGPYQERSRALNAYLHGTYCIRCSRSELPSTHRQLRVNYWCRTSWLNSCADNTGLTKEKTERAGYIYNEMVFIEYIPCAVLRRTWCKPTLFILKVFFLWSNIAARPLDWWHHLDQTIGHWSIR